MDSGYRAGDAVSIHYDPLLAKLVAWDVDRAAALARLRELLGATRVAGVKTNLALLAAVAGHEAFARGAVDTGFIERHRDELLADASRPAASGADTSPALASPWEDVRGWRLGSSERDASVTRSRGGPSQAGTEADPALRGPLVAPMPGRVVAVQVAKGQVVRRGEALMVLEAMKMEHTVAAPADGVVGEVRFAVGDLVDEGAELLVLT